MSRDTEQQFHIMGMFSKHKEQLTLIVINRAVSPMYDPAEVWTG